MGHEHRRRPFTTEAGGPRVADHDISRGQQTCEVRQRTARCHQPRETAGHETQSFADSIRDRMLDGGRPRAHLINRHNLIGYAPDEVEQPG